jgi:hypothetical protein
MISECANPQCRAEFDYRQGEFFRFHKELQDDGRPANTHSVQHFWLCGRCAGMYRLEYAQGKGIFLTLLVGNGLQPGVVRAGSNSSLAPATAS